MKSNNSLNLILLLALIFNYGNLQAQCHMDDWTALKALYESTDGDNWTNNTGWDVHIANQNTPPTNCNLASLYGIDLDGTGRVYRIILSSNQLSGNIPPELGNLSNLWQMSMNNNQLTGSLPAELGGLNNLTGLWLANNQLNGSIPAEIGNLNSLITLLLSGNQLTGNIPPELGNLANLGALILSSNQLNGSIPSELGNLTDLTQLAIAGNHLSGCYPGNLTSLCTQLTTQDFGNNFAATWGDFCNNQAGICIPDEVYNITLPTHYSGYVEVAATLSAYNQYSLQNNAAIVYDYSSCTEYSNLENCNPAFGFENLAANEAFWVASKAAEYFSTYHNIQIPPVNIIVNNAETPNGAYFNPTNHVIMLGAGDGVERTAMTAPDIVAHEYTHAIMHAVKNLGNYGISGALNESYADVFAELIENFCYGYNDNWIYGKQVTVNPNDNYFGLRNLSNPKDITMQYQLPNTCKGDYWIHIDNSCFHEDYCGIHTNSGVHSYWFYLLAFGGTGVNDNGYSYLVNGIGIEKASDIIYKNLVHYLDPSSTLSDARVGSIAIANLEYNNDPGVLAGIIEAWNAVGVFEVEENPIAFRIVNAYQSDPITVAGNTTILPVEFDLTIDSLNMDISADDLCFSLHLPATYQDITFKTVYPPLTVDELSITETAGEMNICIQRTNGGVAKKGNIYPTIVSKSSIVQFGVCIISENVKGEPSAIEPIDISGYTKTGLNEMISFKPSTLPFGFDNNQFQNDPQNMLELSLTLNHKDCQALGTIAIEVINNNVMGVQPYTYSLKKASGNIIDENETNSTVYEFYNLEEGTYELKVEDSDNKRISKEFSVAFVGEPDGSICCAENLIIPPGFIDGMFNANARISISTGAFISEGVFEICE